MESRDVGESDEEVLAAARLDSLVDGALFAKKYRIEMRGAIKNPHCCYAFDQHTYQKVFLKFFPMPFRSQFAKLVRMYKALEHTKHVCSLIETIDTDEAGLPPCMVFERGEFTLKDWLAKGQKSHDQRKSVLREVLRAVKSLHDQNVAHGRLCPANIMWFSADFSWKLLDLGQAHLTSPYASADSLGGGRYVAPEIADRARGELSPECVPDTGADMWSLGLIAFELSTNSTVLDPTGVQAFVNSKLHSVLQGVEAALCATSSPCTQTVSVPTGDLDFRFVHSLLRNQPCQRIKASSALEADIFDFIENPDQHTGVTQSLPKYQATANLALEEWAVLDFLASDIDITVKVEDFQGLGVDNPIPFHSRPSTEVLYFFDDFLPKYPVYIAKLDEEFMLNFRITDAPHKLITIDRLSDLIVETPEGDRVSLETHQSREDRALSIKALLKPSDFPPGRINSISPAFGKVERKYVGLLVHFRVCIGGVLARDIDLYKKIYCKVVHPRNRMRIAKWVGMFENHGNKRSHRRS